MTRVAGDDLGEAFERGWIAMAYVLGRRGRQLAAELDVTGRAAANLTRALVHPSRPVRARILAAELARLVYLVTQRDLR
jgi:hypothetical protein